MTVSESAADFVFQKILHRKFWKLDPRIEPKNPSANVALECDPLTTRSATEAVKRYDNDFVNVISIVIKRIRVPSHLDPLVITNAHHDRQPLWDI